MNELSHNPDKQELETAVLGNGCFWCTEAIFQQVPGIVSVTSGYCGGKNANPTYSQICTGETGHAECLQIKYQPKIISFEQLLTIFWSTHDPTTLNRQGNDIGTQYRSVIFYRDELQREIAASSISQLDASKVLKAPVVTTLEPLAVFYPAENYHQNYYNLHQNEPYCRFVIRPKLEKFNKNEFPHT